MLVEPDEQHSEAFIATALHPHGDRLLALHELVAGGYRFVTYDLSDGSVRYEHTTRSEVSIRWLGDGDYAILRAYRALAVLGDAGATPLTLVPIETRVESEGGRRHRA